MSFPNYHSVRTDRVDFWSPISGHCTHWDTRFLDEHGRVLYQASIATLFSDDAVVQARKQWTKETNE